MPSNPAPSRFLETARGLKLHYTVHPAEGVEAGVVVFIHGSGPGASGWSNFKQNVAAFQSGGYRCVVYDQWGYGQTDKPTDVDHSLDFFVEGLLALLDGLGAKYTVVELNVVEDGPALRAELGALTGRTS